MNSPYNQLPQLADLILVNLIAGGGRAGRLIPAVRESLLANNWKAEVVSSADAADLGRLARAAAARGHKRILALGGDGTFQVLLNALAERPEVILGVIPAGGGNDLAAALRIPCDPVQAIALLGNAESRRIDVVRVSTASGEKHLYAGGGGLGLDAEAAYFASTAFSNWKGRFRYVAAALRAYRRFVALRIRVTMFSRDWEGPRVLEENVLVLAILNTPSYGAGLRLSPGAKLDDGNLNLVAVADLNIFEIFKLLPALLLSGELRTQRTQRFSIQRAIIESSRPAQYHGDGEILGMTPLEVEVLPHFVQILVPRRGDEGSD